MAGKAGLSDKERALIEAARREVAAGATAAQAARQATAPRPAPALADTRTVASPGGGVDGARAAPQPAQEQAATGAAAPERPAVDGGPAAAQAARIAALMAAERAETERRRRRARRWGIHLPMTLLALALVWMTLRQFG